MRYLYLIIFLAVITNLFPAQSKYDVIIRNGTIYDGSGNKPYVADLGVNGDKIVFIGSLKNAHGKKEIDATGLAVSPGFINMLSWANETLIEDGKSQSDLRQGVTLEVMGEGWSMGPLNEKMRKESLKEEGDIKYDITWTTFGDYLQFLQDKGISTNVASFVGAASVRIYVLGYEDRAPNKRELKRMQDLVAEAMKEGALGVGSALIYAPGFYAKTDELVALCKTAAEYGGMYISHIRSEGNDILNALDELITISREAHIPAEVYHIKAAGKSNWNKLDSVINKIETARKQGLKITADMYNYTAAATGLDATMPPWVQEGGLEKWISRLKQDSIRQRVKREMTQPTKDWENFFLMSGSPENILLVGFKTDSLKYLTGKTLGEAAKIKGESPEETAMDLVIQDGSRVSVVYFVMSEENVREKIKLPWVSFGSDEGSLAPEGVFLKSQPHPRAYGNVARLLGKYVREEKLIPLQEAVRRLSAFPAENLKFKYRGKLQKGYFADIVIFNPETIKDNATYEDPQKYATGVKDVFVNGIQVIADGEHTGKKPGRFLKGPGWKPGENASK